jgi:biopolymer transport protein ExbD
MMQPLELNFVATRRGAAWIGRVLLALAACVALDAGLSYHSARKVFAENQARLTKRTPAGAPKVSPQEVVAVRETVQRLSLRWDELFVALESAASDKVALAAIEPDPRNGTVTISGDGKDYLAALSYVLNLSHTEGLERVQLVRHEQKNEGVSFAVSAAWSAK